MRKFVAIILTVFMVLGFSAMASAAPATFFDFNSDGIADTTLTVPNIGDTFSADIYFDWNDVNATTELGLINMGVGLSYDFSQINVTAVTPYAGWFLVDVENGSVFDNLIGAATMSGGKFPGDTGNPLLLGTIDFQCVGAGVSTLAMENLISLFTGADPDSFVSMSGTVFDSDMTFGLAEVTQAPIPGAVWLFGSGLIGLVGLRRRKSC